jgi:hypothetical protein
MAKTLVYEGGKSLDFLGFSRPNRAFSMGYARFSLKEISRALRRADGSVGMAPVFFEDRGTELFMRKLSSFSDFMK